MGFCSCVNKLFLIVLNFVIFAVGAGVIILASIVIHRGHAYGELFLDGILTLPILTLIVGIIITLLGFFGCCGAMRESKCMLLTYAIIVSVLFLAEVVLGILVAIYPDKASDLIKDGMGEAFKKYGSGDASLSKTIDNIQHDLQCCGIEGPRDWVQDFNASPPISCCRDGGSCNTNNDSNLFQDGCFDKIVSDLKGITIALGIAAIVLGVVQIVCICIACALAQKRHQYV